MSGLARLLRRRLGDYQSRLAARPTVPLAQPAAAGLVRAFFQRLWRLASR